MGTSIRLKKSSVSSNAPGTSDIDYGELAINYADGKLYYKTSSNAIDFFTAGSGDSTLLDGVTAGTVTASKAVIVDSNKDITGFRNVTTTGNTTLGDGVGDALTINAGTVDIPNVSAGTDNTVLVYNGSTILTDEIDSRVWGSTLVDGSGTANTVTKWSDSNTLTDSLITDDGTTVSITTNTTSDALLITTTEASSTAAPVITLKRNSGSPADSDYLGQLKFKGENDADQEVNYAKITAKISDASDGTEDGLLEYMLKGGGSNVIAARLTSTDLKLINGVGLEVAGNTTLGDASGDSVTINAATIALANVAAGTDNTVLVYNGSTVLTDEIDSRVWGSTLVDGSGTANTVTKWSDSNTVTNSVITDDGSTVTIGGNLTVNGTTTTLNATNSVVTDNLFELNSGVTSNANDSGIVIERGSTGNNALFIWDESADKFAVGTTTATADSTGNITYADAGLIAGSLDISGAVQIDSTLTVGVDDTGHDVKFFGATAGASMLWDESANGLCLTGSDYQFKISDGSNQPWYTRVVSNTYRLHLNGTGDILSAAAAGITLSGATTMASAVASVKFAVGISAVHGSFDFYNQGTAYFNGATTIDDTLTIGADDTGFDVKFFGATSGSYMLWDESIDDLILGGAARLGIGTTTPSQTLHIENTTSSGAYINFDGQSNSEFGLRIESNAGGGNFESDFGVGGTAMLDLYANSTSTSGGDFLVARTKSATPVFLVKGNGKVGIGTASPANTLDVNGSLKINGEVVEKTVNTTGVTGSTALDPANGTVQRLVFSGNVTFTDSLADGESITLHIDDGSGNVVSAWPTITWATGSAPTLNTGTDTIVAVWKVNSTLYGATVGTSQDVVSDTTPQLGGNLDVNGKDIVSASNGDIELAPNGSGVVIFKGDSTKGAGQFKLNCEQNSHGITIKGPPHSATASYTLVLPNDDGSANQVLTSDGSGNLSWTTPAGSYADSSVNTHLNQSSAGSGEVLSWNGSDYAWVANAGTSGGTSGTSDRIISIDAGALVTRTTNGAAAATEEYATNDVMSDHFLFDGATEEGVQFRFHMPSDWDGTTVNAKFYWDGATGASASDGVTWGIAMQAFQNDDALDNAFGTSVDTDDALIAVGDLHVTAESAAITIAGSPSAGDLIFAEVTRVVGDSNDTMTEDAKLVGVTIHYTASVSSQVAINTQTGTTYTTVLTDASKLVTLNNGSAITLTIPPNSSVAYPIGTKIDLLQIGAGQVTVAAGSGVTVNSTPTLKLRAQYSGGTCIQYAANTWIFAGDLAAS